MTKTMETTDTTTEKAPSSYRLPEYADIAHLRGCPASDEQPSYPMPRNIETYTLTLPDLAGRTEAPVHNPPVRVSHCCLCGGLGYRREGE